MNFSSDSPEFDRTEGSFDVILITVFAIVGIVASVLLYYFWTKSLEEDIANVQCIQEDNELLRYKLESVIIEPNKRDDEYGSTKTTYDFRSSALKAQLQAMQLRREYTRLLPKYTAFKQPSRTSESHIVGRKGQAMLTTSASTTGSDILFKGSPWLPDPLQDCWCCCSCGVVNLVPLAPERCPVCSHMRDSTCNFRF